MILVMIPIFLMGEFSFFWYCTSLTQSFLLCFRSPSQSLCSSTLRLSAGGWDRHETALFLVGLQLWTCAVSNLQQDSFPWRMYRIANTYHRCILVYTYMYIYNNYTYVFIDVYARSAVYMLLISYDDMIMLIQCATFTSHNFPYAAFFWHCRSSMADHDLRKYPATDIFDAWQNLSENSGEICQFEDFSS